MLPRISSSGGLLPAFKLNLPVGLRYSTFSISAIQDCSGSHIRIRTAEHAGGGCPDGDSYTIEGCFGHAATADKCCSAMIILAQGASLPGCQVARAPRSIILGHRRVTRCCHHPLDSCFARAPCPLHHVPTLSPPTTTWPSSTAMDHSCLSHPDWDRLVAVDSLLRRCRCRRGRFRWSKHITALNARSSCSSRRDTCRPATTSPASSRCRPSSTSSVQRTRSIVRSDPIVDGHPFGIDR